MLCKGTKMPSVLIEVRRQYPQDQETAIIEAVHGALVEAFHIPAHDRDLRLLVHEPHRYACPPNLAQPEYYTLVSIDAFAGRSLDAKRRLYRAIVDNLAPCGIPRDHVKILLCEIPQENWGVRGGQAACDVELGFKVEI
jgi:phenylpyruvate tautomerase PptA (4-oxalocrotonate tautomerase family)